MSRFEKNLHYSGKAEPLTARYWMGHVLLRSPNGLSFIGLEDRLVTAMGVAVTNDVKFYNVVAAEERQLLLGFELASDYPSTASDVIAHITYETLATAGLLGELQAEAGSLVNGTKFDYDTMDSMELGLDYYTEPDSELQKALTHEYEQLLGHATLAHVA